MFDIGGWEFLLIAILGIIIIGPKELPGAIRTVSMFVRRARELARDFQSGLEDMAREAELDNLTDDLLGKSDPDSGIGGLRKELEDAVDPDGNIRDSMDFSADWKDDDLIDYDDPEFADENKMHVPDLEGDTQKTTGMKEGDAADETRANSEAKPETASEDVSVAPGKKPDTAS